MAQPLISDLAGQTKLRFKPGDRILVRTYSQLPPAARKERERSIRRAVERFAGEPVRVLIVDVLCVRLTRIRGDDVDDLIPVEFLHEEAGVANVSCSVVDLRPDDILLFRHQGWDNLDTGTRKQKYAQLKEWAGDVDVRFMDFTTHPQM